MAKVVNPELGRRVAQRREKFGLPQKGLALLVGMKQQGIGSIEKGEVLRPRLLREIAAALRTTEDWLLYATPPEDAPDPIVGPNFTYVPQIDWVEAGRATEPAFEPQDVPLLAFADLGRGDFFALKVQGDSMDRVSPEGSVIVVNRADTQLVTGRFYVFSLKGATTYKAWHDGNPQYLKPFSTNPAHDPIHFRRRDLGVVGRVCRSMISL